MLRPIHRSLMRDKNSADPIYDKFAKSNAMLGFVPQPNLQVTVINQHLNYAMLRLLANPIFYERIKK